MSREFSLEDRLSIHELVSLHGHLSGSPAGASCPGEPRCSHDGWFTSFAVGASVGTLLGDRLPEWLRDIR